MPSLLERDADAPPPLSIDEALEALVAEAQRPAKSRSVSFRSTVDGLCEEIYTNGLSSAQLSSLINLITGSHYLDQSSLGAIIRNLYPAGKVGNDVVVKVVCALGQGVMKPKPAIQGLLVRWLILVYGVVEDQTLLGKMYGVLFNMLDMISLRSSICHLLGLMTRRKHVKPFRIQMLMDLSRKVGHDPAIVGLLRVYKDYYPDVIVGDAVAGRASFFTHPDLEWRDHLVELQESNAHKIVDDTDAHQPFRVVRQGFKRTKVFVPEVRTVNAQMSSVTLEEIDSVDNFVDNVDKLELPSQVISVLRDPLLQKYLLLKPSAEASERINNWLEAFFEDEMQDLAEGKLEGGSGLAEVLQLLVGYTRYAKTLLPACDAFLQVHLLDWDGITNRAEILELLTYLPIQNFEVLQETHLQALETAITENDLSPQSTLLPFYTSLFRRWKILASSLPPSDVETTAAITALVKHTCLLTSSLLFTTTTTTKQDSSSSSSPSSSSSGSADQSSISLILSFYETLSTALTPSPTSPKNNPHIRISTPPAHLIYTLFFSPSVAVLSRLCHILSLYKKAFENAMVLSAAAAAAAASKNTLDGGGVVGGVAGGVTAATEAHNQHTPPPYPRPYVNEFNSFLMDVANNLWRNRAFNRDDTNALGNLFPPHLLPPLRAYIDTLSHSSYALPSLFSLSYNPALCALAIEAFRGLEDRAAAGGGAAADAVGGVGGVDAVEGEQDTGIETRHAGPISQRSLTLLAQRGGLKISWSEYRLEVLRFLEARGAGGVGELMFCTMKHLMGGGKGGVGGSSGGAGVGV